MRLELDFDKSLEENASLYFEQSKKAKKKLLGLKQAIEQTKKETAKKWKRGKEAPKPAKKKKREWYRSFHWFFSSDGFLVLGGRSAKDNEQLVKKHLGSEDVFLHADIPGGAATIIKTSGKKVPESTFREAAQFAAVFSRAWKESMAAVDVYAVKAGQVSKSAPSGTALATGAFMVYGKRRCFRKTPLLFAVGIAKKNGATLISGPPSAVKKNAICSVELRQGAENAGSAAKKTLALLVECSKKQVSASLDDIAQMIPGSNIKVEKID
jgi:predicted ribosome quality control (RQC) complex YloA/Tae2 family protein